MTKPESSFDIIVYGATSFVGKIIVEYLSISANKTNEAPLRWAIAGRSEAKLLTLKKVLDLDKIEHFIADANDEVALRALAERSKVIMTTVGPYALYGETLVKVCATTGTDYCDLTGEPQWIARMLEKYEPLAKQSGARMIHSAGFDSIPSDIGVYVSQNKAIELTGKPASHIKMRVRKIKGAASGGTIASMLNVFKEAKENPALRKVLVNPYVLCPTGHGFKARQKNHKKAEFDKDLAIWTMPFVMAAINERIVHRTNALLDNQYGNDFKYDEAMSAKTGLQAWIFTLGLGSFVLAASISPLRKFLANYVLPKSGEGPSPKAQLEGMYDMRFYADLSNGHQLVVKVEGDRDPGYGSTAKILSQVAICLAKDVPNLKGGCWTPVSGLKDSLIKRLERHAGVSVNVISAK